MGTPFIEIYDLNSVIQLDSRLFGKPKNLIYSLKYKWLMFSISYFVSDCNKDLEDYIPFSQTEYEFVGDGVTDTYDLTSTPTTDMNFFLSVNDDSLNYTYTIDYTNNKILINPIPPIAAEIYFSAYTIGSFNNILSLEEKRILAEGMNVPWFEQQRNKDDLLNQMVYNGDAKIYSQANHIQVVDTLTDNQYYKTVQSMINKYSFKHAVDDLIGLGGGLPSDSL